MAESLRRGQKPHFNILSAPLKVDAQKLKHLGKPHARTALGPGCVDFLLSVEANGLTEVPIPAGIHPCHLGGQT
ncbi:hypothetical protein CTA1_2864 [Colletotrichum tanaceti]|uniref:Uncharacterized protein n=1 Tax=Colletotrichum tanaceti TaxID=1306861 RepID=A0A4U6XFF8_9PEZI|nr:hypothetical protein CTA1_2864 [Colletotrichum tanaceti]